MALPSIPIAHPQKHFFSIDNELVYWNFFLDFGPLNLGQTYRFCSMLNSKLADSRLKDKVIYYYSGTHPHRRANAAFLICAWCVLCLDKSADEAYRPFKAAATPFPPWVSFVCVKFHGCVSGRLIFSHGNLTARCNAYSLYLQSDGLGHS